MTKRLYIGLIFIFGVSNFQPLYAQANTSLKQGFNASEYADLLWLAFYGFSDSLAQVPQFDLAAGSYRRQMRSPEVGLYNQCEIYLRSDSVIVLSLRGTVNKPESWMENFYAAMIPATGSLQLTDDYTFNYQFAKRADAAVHIGWTIGTGFLAREYMPALKALLERGLHEVIVTGHSQGGALSFLNASHLHYHLKDAYPKLHFKVYASAAPKPGNLYYAYDFDHLLGAGFAFRVVNTEDWVPETPISVQGLADFNQANPFVNAKNAIKAQKFPARVALKYMYKSMRNGSAKAANRYKRFLGTGVGKQATKSLPGYVAPEYLAGNNYMTAGAPIILMPDEVYHEKFKFDSTNVFIHHLYAPYLYLLKQYEEAAKPKD